ncbi:hypothetical protein CYMTET_15420 [Cymbomonas tetramitiformis]|uniref:carbonic anhydrase n=1 Tax=Cymbomonas tetramitiformis TaxID=36881 RepID=A0AAE0GE29_9CHLO|nr:hypothetical protein CYMTET_15420 [Cymbomonas tetramitiformis]
MRQTEIAAVQWNLDVELVGPTCRKLSAGQALCVNPSYSYQNQWASGTLAINDGAQFPDNTGSSDSGGSDGGGGTGAGSSGRSGGGGGRHIYAEDITSYPEIGPDTGSENDADAGSRGRSGGGNDGYTYTMPDTASALGPESWSKHYPGCGGQSQSPINLPAIDEATQDAGSDLGQGLNLNGLCKSYKGAVNYNTWKVTDFADCNSGGPPSITYQGEEYTMLQFHWHAPSEHSVDGKLYDAETHFVHQKVGSTGTDDLLVIGVLLTANTDTDNAFLADFWPNFDNAKHDIPAGINPYATFYPKQGNTSYYAYSGSLTTPPCDETVQWIVFTTPAPMSYNQLDVYKAAVAGLPQSFVSLTNNRPIQDLNDRTVSVVSDIGYVKHRNIHMKNIYKAWRCNSLNFVH